MSGTPAFVFEGAFCRALPIIANAPDRLAEAREVCRRIVGQGVPLHVNMDHAAIYTEPVRQVSGPLRTLGYDTTWDDRCYPSPVDNVLLYLIVHGLPKRSTQMREEGWFENIATVFPIDDDGHGWVDSQKQGNPFIHHLTMGIVPPTRGTMNDKDYALRVVPFMVDVRRRIQQGVGEQAGNLVIALPDAVVNDSDFVKQLPELTQGLDTQSYKLESMQGGGFLLQFFVLAGGRVEVALRQDTVQAFNPNSVRKISTDEISIRRELLEKPLAPM
jgi:hypothetical protein